METVGVSDAPTVAPGPDVNAPERVTIAKLAVLHDFLVVRPLAPPSKKTGSLLHMPEIAQERERSHRGIVLAVGPGDYNEPGTARVPMTIAPGDLVFFGKFSGTEEEVGGRTVLVMRESELRFAVPAGAFKVIEHENPRLDHLVEDWCDTCYGVPLEEAAAERLALERAQLVANQGLTCHHCGHVAGNHLHLTGPCRECDSCLEFQTAGAAAAAEPVDERPSRPCAEPGCLYMQRFDAFNDHWTGAICGHVHQTRLVIEP